MKIPCSRIRGFSLIELMVVMLIIGVIAAFVVPASSTILRGSQMTQGSQILVDQLTLARQTALARNHQVEVRFIRFTDPETPGDTGADGSAGNFRAVWVFEDTGALDYVHVDSGGNPTSIMAPVDKPQTLPQSIVMSTTAVLSTLLQNPSKNPSNYPTDPQTYPRSSISSSGVPYTYIPFRFNPDGSTNLTPQTSLWFVTLQNINDKPANGKPPTNFFTVLVDSVGGTLKTFRPGV